MWESRLRRRGARYRTTTVFRRVEGRRVETYVLERGIAVHHQLWDNQRAAVVAVAGRLLGTSSERPTPRSYDGPAPTTVEELKDAFAELGIEPDNVARPEVLFWSGQGEDITLVETLPGGRVLTYYRERGVDKGYREWPDEATAIADLVSRPLERYSGRSVTDLQVERMRAHAAHHREVMRKHGPGSSANDTENEVS